MAKDLLTAEEAYQKVAGKHYTHDDVVQPIGTNSAFLCQHCDVVADHMWGTVQSLGALPTPGSLSSRPYFPNISGVIAAALCQNCGLDVIFHNGNVLVPAHSNAPLPSEDMPKELVDDYLEAREIVSSSPRGAAALLRFLIQKLCPILGSTKSDINGAIGELVASGVINKQLQQALDTVRVVGNEAVHPGTLDLNDDPATAMSLFRLVNFIIEKGITEPKQIGELYQSLPPGKLAGIAQRDKPAT